MNEAAVWSNELSRDILSASWLRDSRGHEARLALIGSAAQSLATRASVCGEADCVARVDAAYVPSLTARLQIICFIRVFPFLLSTGLFLQDREKE